MISSTLYKQLADLLNSAQEHGPSMISHISQMNTDMRASEIPSDDHNRQILMDALGKTYDKLNQNHAIYTSHMLEVVRQLQKHVDTNYSSVNDFLNDNAIQVKSTFADMSHEVGYTIEATFIESLS